LEPFEFLLRNWRKGRNKGLKQSYETLQHYPYVAKWKSVVCSSETRFQFNVPSFPAFFLSIHEVLELKLVCNVGVDMKINNFYI
jgi:hypothetical protein